MKGMKKLLSVMMACLMMSGLFAMNVSAASPTIKIAGQEVYVATGASYFVNNGGGLTKEGADESNYNVKYDAATKTLTLRNAAVTYTNGGGSSEAMGSYIYIATGDDVNVCVEGTNTFVPEGTNKSAPAIIYAEIKGKTLSFAGTGSFYGLGRYHGINAKSDSDSNIIFNGGTYTFDVKDQGSGSPVFGAAYSGKMTVNAGKVTFDARYTYSSGSSYDAYGLSGGTFVINGGYCKIVGYSRGTNGYAVRCGSNGYKGVTYNGGCLEMYAGLNSPSYDCGNRISDNFPFAESEALNNANISYATYFDGTTLSDVYTTSYQRFISANGPYYSARSYMKVGDIATYTVTYTDGVADVEVFADQVTGNLEAGVATPAFEGPLTRLGYTFTGWTPEVADLVTGNATYTATWAKDYYTVTYTDGVADVEVFVDQVTSNLEYDAATPAFEGPTDRPGYTFTGWNPTVADKVTGNATYEATWTKDQYTVTYNDGVDGELVFSDQATTGLEYGDATPAFDGTPTRLGYTFTGWEPEVADLVTGNATYEATWTKDEYTVTYTDGVEDAEVFADQSTPGLGYGDATPAFEGTTDRPGYTFTGWTPEVVDTVTGNATYTATWSKNQYTVTYNDGVDGEIVFSDQATTGLGYGDATPAFVGTPTRIGYAFKGWAPAVAATVTADATYVATWEEIVEISVPDILFPTIQTSTTSPKTADTNMSVALWAMILTSGAVLVKGFVDRRKEQE